MKPDGIAVYRAQQTLTAMEWDRAQGEIRHIVRRALMEQMASALSNDCLSVRHEDGLVHISMDVRVGTPADIARAVEVRAQAISSGRPVRWELL